MKEANYDYSYMYFYSERPGTLAAKRYKDDIPEEVKKRRLQEIVDVQWVLSNESNKRDVGKTFEILIEGNSKKSDQEWMGRNSQNKVIVFPKGDHGFKKGDYVNVLVNDFTKGTLLGTVSK
jgi:tRNA-2-methylthio-N6-dimethylallyladenosine synthase